MVIMIKEYKGNKSARRQGYKGTRDKVTREERDKVQGYKRSSGQEDKGTR